MKKKILSKLYEPSVHRMELLKMLNEFSAEVYGVKPHYINIKHFENAHETGIYILENEDGEIVGFTSFIYNCYYGMREATIGNDFVYVRPEFRRTRAMHIASIQAGEVAKHFGRPMEHYFVAGSGSEKFKSRMEGNLIYNAVEYSLDTVVEELDYLKSKINTKESK